MATGRTFSFSSELDSSFAALRITVEGKWEGVRVCRERVRVCRERVRVCREGE